MIGLLNKMGNSIYSKNAVDFNLDELLDDIYTMDWVSLLVADSRSIVSSEIPNILELKAYMLKV